MPMHDLHLDRWKYVINEANVILSKSATIHQCNWVGDWFATGYPTAHARFQNYSTIRSTARGKFPRGTIRERYSGLPLEWQ
jgi:hypothetical protein